MYSFVCSDNKAYHLWKIKLKIKKCCHCGGLDRLLFAVAAPSQTLTRGCLRLDRPGLAAGGDGYCGFRVGGPGMVGSRPGNLPFPRKP